MRGALVLLLVMVVACGSTRAVSPARGSQLYTVTSSIMQKPGEPPRACFAMALPLPPIGCGGPFVGGIDLASLPGYTTYSNGVRAAGMVRLVGTWNGGELTVTEPPRPAPASEATKAPSCQQDGSEPQGPGLPPMMQKVADDDSLLKAKGIQILEMYMCKTALFLLVPVADQATVDFFQNRYGDVVVAGWLQPVA